MTAEAVGLFLDYSKNRVTAQTLKLLLRVADKSCLQERIEKRAVLHVALRVLRNESILVDGRNVALDVHAVLDKMADSSEPVRSGVWKGHTGKRIRNDRFFLAENSKLRKISAPMSKKPLPQVTWAPPCALLKTWRTLSQPIIICANAKAH